MKKLVLFLFLPLLLLVPAKVFAANIDYGWSITDFNSQVEILKDGKVSVNETIRVDYNGVQKHGIYRDLIYKKDSSDIKKHYISYEIQSLTIDGEKVNYTTGYTSDFYRVQIGDPLKTITGVHTYKVVYLALGAIRSFTEGDELYWNVTGNYWTIPINKAIATVVVPGEGVKRITCYQGVEGSKSPCDSSQNNKNEAKFTATTLLNSGEGLTVVTGFTKGLVPILEGKNPPLFLIDPIDILIFSLIFFPILIFMIILWWKRGRDYWFKRRFLNDPNQTTEVEPIGGHDTIVVEFDPPDKLRPGEMGQILFEDFHAVALTATIVDLAVRGYLRINEVEKGFILKSKDYELIKLDKTWDDLLAFENSLLSGVFGNNDIVAISSLKRTLYLDVKSVKEKLNQEMVDKKFFVENPGKVKSKYNGSGISLIIISLVLFGTPFSNVFPHEIAVLLSLASSGVVILIVGFFMSRRTAAGHEMKNRILGYKLFISTAEKYRQQFFERQNMFNEVLPYAILFGVADKFAKAFATLGTQPPPPTWYTGTAVFNAAVFSTSMASFASSFNSSMSSSSGFSGGGAGGGGGGGGGGGW